MYICSIELSPLVGKDQGSPSISRAYFLYDYGRKKQATSNHLRLSGNIWLVSFKISYLCLPLFYETRTTPSCHPSGCAYRQL